MTGVGIGFGFGAERMRLGNKGGFSPRLLVKYQLSNGYLPTFFIAYDSLWPISL